MPILNENRYHSMNTPVFIPLDLSTIANRAHRHSADPRAEVWEGDPANALEQLPSGSLRLGGVPFTILDAETHPGGSVAALHPKDPDGLPSQVTFPFTGKEKVVRLHFLMAFGGMLKDQEVGAAILYSGSKETARLPFVTGVNAGNWWWPQNLPEADLAWIGANGKCLRVGIYHVTWELGDALDPAPTHCVLKSTGARLFLIAATAGLAGAPVSGLPEASGISSDPQRYNRFGGWRSRSLRATGFFYTAPIEGRWWLVDPEGHLFLSKGVNAVVLAGDPSPALGGRMLYRENVLRKLGNANAWRSRVLARMGEWNINTLGCWSDPEFSAGSPHFRILNCATRAGANWFGRRLCDVWSPAFSDACRQAAETECAAGKNDPLLIGYFTDNEMPFVKGADATDHILTQYLKLPSDAAGRCRAIELLRKWYDLDTLNRSWKTSFTSFNRLEAPSEETPGYASDANRFASEVMQRYCETVAAEIRKVDPNHLIIGCRFAFLNRSMKEILEIAARHFDIISFNHYRENPLDEGMEMLRDVCNRIGKPAMITEFAFRGDDVGLPNTFGAGPRVPDQFTRAWGTGRYLERAFAEPHIVGCHLFKWSDQPASGRFDGENSNYGLVTLRDEVYPDMTRTVRRVYGEAELRHATGCAD